LNRFENQTLAQEDAIIFDDGTPVAYGKCGFVNNTTALYVWGSGYYNASFTIYHNEPCQFSIFLNGNVVPGTITGSATGSSVCTISHIVVLSEADIAVSPTGLSPSGFAAKIELVNHTSYVPLVTIDGTTGAGSAVPQSVAALSMFKLADLPPSP